MKNEWNKWKYHFYEMKGDIGMSVHEKERKQEDAYTKTQLIHNPIPTSLFLSSPQCISYSQFNVRRCFYLPNAFTTNKQNSKQRCRDGVMNELCLGVGIFLFPFFFMH